MASKRYAIDLIASSSNHRFILLTGYDTEYRLRIILSPGFFCNDSIIE